MDDVAAYLIELRGRVDEADLNALSPLKMKVLRGEGGEDQPYASMRLSVRTDQSGVIGVLRHLHGMGIVFLSVSRVEADDPVT